MGIAWIEPDEAPRLRRPFSAAVAVPPYAQPFSPLSVQRQPAVEELYLAPPRQYPHAATVPPVVPVYYPARRVDPALEESLYQAPPRPYPFATATQLGVNPWPFLRVNRPPVDEPEFASPPRQFPIGWFPAIPSSTYFPLTVSRPGEVSEPEPAPAPRRVYPVAFTPDPPYLPWSPIPPRRDPPLTEAEATSPRPSFPQGLWQQPQFMGWVPGAKPKGEAARPAEEYAAPGRRPWLYFVPPAPPPQVWLPRLRRVEIPEAWLEAPPETRRLRFLVPGLPPLTGFTGGPRFFVADPGRVWVATGDAGTVYFVVDPGRVWFLPLT